MDQPLLASVFFRSRAALSALGAKLLMGAALIIALVTVPLMANTVLEQSPLEGGLRLMRLTGAMPIGALLGGYLAYRVGARVVAAVGLMVAAIGLFLMSGWEIDISDPQLTIHLALAGLGFGLVIAPLFVTAMDAGPDDYQATAASLVTVARMIGMALGLAALSAGLLLNPRPGLFLAKHRNAA
ncbi:MAG: MFS transporter [Planctomycetes bacterium]|nr:MFS transporter [Planctomycetota bacterium]